MQENMTHRKPRATVIKRMLAGLESVMSTHAQTISQLMQRREDQSTEIPASQSEDDRERVKFQTLDKHCSFQKRQHGYIQPPVFFSITLIPDQLFVKKGCKCPRLLSY